MRKIAEKTEKQTEQKSRTYKRKPLEQRIVEMWAKARELKRRAAKNREKAIQRLCVTLLDMSGFDMTESMAETINKAEDQEIVEMIKSICESAVKK